MKLIHHSITGLILISSVLGAWPSLAAGKAAEVLVQVGESPVTAADLENALALLTLCGAVHYAR